MTTVTYSFIHEDAYKYFHERIFSVYYPTTSPVGIVSVCDPSKDSLLLIRQPRYPPGMYSCIAGFLDVGETLDDCVRREVAEEVGIEVTKVNSLNTFF